ncbi:FadR/GntR family transcriptional regulator [Neobacillus mesonae]|uniref:FadR/GntR family transcriptional regulator n=1 Tax=Neobacillus mesonae TaxID=1193713 RepID=UPI00203B2C52|nr:FadR/GntR family transcriptional regulator [Neobacillus mesonae]MCM3566948.1 FadR family transcriptional regulator [Neobacillus mesonae]
MKNKKICEEILEQMKELLVSGHLTVGQRIPSEIELSETLGVSRSSLREALRVLDVLGIIEAKTGDGTFIKEAKMENIGNIMTLVALSKELETSDLYEVRIILESYAASLAAERRSNEDLAIAKKYLLKADNGSTGEEGSLLDHLFHSSVIKASKNNVLVMLMDMISGLLSEQIKSTRTLFSSSAELMELIQKQHWEIYDAIEQQKPLEAQKKVFDHLNNAKIIINLKQKS